MSRLVAFLFSRHPGAVAGIVILGLFSSLAEGIGITLFLPFLHALSDPAALEQPRDRFLGGLYRLFADVDPDVRLPVIAACIFVSIVVKAALSYGHLLVQEHLTNRVGHELRSRLYGQVLSLSLRFVEGTHASKLWNTLTTETWRAVKALSTSIQLLITTCMLLVYLALLLLLSWPLTLLVCVFMLLVSALVLRLTQRVSRYSRRAVAANERLAQRMIEGFQGLRIIRAFGREAYEKERFDDVSLRVSRTFYRMSALNGTVGPVYEVFTAALLVILLVGFANRPGGLPELLVFVFVLYRVQPRVKALDSARVELKSLAPAVQEVWSLLDAAEPGEAPGGEPVRTLTRQISFEGVTFRYKPDAEPALDDVSFEIPAGKTTALVGPSGAGKSSVLHLLLRFFDPDSGMIRADGRPLQRLDLADWRRRFAVVSQDVYLFDASVRDNIAYGRPEATEEEIVDAARRADAHEFIVALRDGYDTVLGHDGNNLSGGQRQRLTLARAILRDPEILLLDEATNALDGISERVILDAIDLMREGRTLIVVTHRIGTIARADQIVVLDGGRVRASGRAPELIERDELFAELFHLQHSQLAS